MNTRLARLTLLTGICAFVGITSVPTTLQDFFLPGSQPNQSGTFTASCSCHDGYNTNVEPAFNWRGSMMAQAARDPLFLAAMTIANQDAEYVGDLCIRCHAPVGWLEGRSLPTDGSSLIAKDREGVQCEFCHRMVKPFPWESIHIRTMCGTGLSFPHTQAFPRTRATPRTLPPFPLARQSPGVACTW